MFVLCLLLMEGGKFFLILYGSTKKLANSNCLRGMGEGHVSHILCYWKFVLIKKYAIQLIII